MARALDCDRQGPLVAGAGAKLAAWLDLAALGKMAAKTGDILIIDFIGVVGAETADLAARAETATAATASATALRPIAAVAITTATLRTGAEP